MIINRTSDQRSGFNRRVKKKHVSTITVNVNKKRKHKNKNRVADNRIELWARLSDVLDILWSSSSSLSQ